MSRIDEALKRLAGVTAPETRMPQMLERYASESPGPEDSDKPGRGEDHKIATFVAPGRRPLEPRSTAAAEMREVLASSQAAHVTTAQAPRSRAAEIDQESASEPIIEIRQVVNYVGFVARSVARHKLLAAAVVVVTIALTVTAVVLLPKTYHVQTTLFAQRNAVMTALSNPGRAVPWDADAPTRAAAETVLRRDNLISLINRTDLVKEWDRTRAPVLKLKDRLVAFVTGHTPTTDDKLEALIDTLEKKMVVNAGPVGDGTVTIDLHWPDAEMGYRLVQAAHDAFLEARQIAETAAIGESIGILERYSATLHRDIDRTLAELHRAEANVAPSTARRRRIAPKLPAPTVSAAAVTDSVPQLQSVLDADEDLYRLKTALTTKRRELAGLEDERRKQFGEIQSKIEQLKATYTANHPSVIAAQQLAAAASRESPKAAMISAEIEELQAEYDKRLTEATDRQLRASLASASVATPSQAPAPPIRIIEEVEPPPAPPSAARASDAQFATLRLSTELSQLRSVVERTDAARIELAVSQAAFKYRYTVIRPAQIPKEPTFPKTKQIVGIGVVMSLFFAIALVVAKDLLSNRVLEVWQVQRQLGLRVLGTLRGA